ncbi:hypothetical protein [Oricola cellulosilytica]|uniref:Uncharacterized protein n=1 Tax=Oricola cellulosilytica TaxID=1429082 RepID=A0A4R0PDV3_9HYPH|nr:hypothetical protein [Oricola cellulosilytica]TCD14933.1 hypothetical protein E0D97_05085 [Oricola cellulosilytica]
MDSQIRSTLSLARQTHYFDVMRTTIFAFVGLAAIIELGPEGYSAPLTMLVISVTAFGILAGSTALEDVRNLIADLDTEMAQTNFGKGIKARNVKALKAISAILIGLIGVAELYAIFT